MSMDSGPKSPLELKRRTLARVAFLFDQLAEGSNVIMLDFKRRQAAKSRLARVALSDGSNLEIAYSGNPKASPREEAMYRHPVNRGRYEYPQYELTQSFNPQHPYALQEVYRIVATTDPIIAHDTVTAGNKVNQGLVEPYETPIEWCSLNRLIESAEQATGRNPDLY